MMTSAAGERCGHHADHGHLRAADGNRAADDRRVATELPLPQRVAEDDLEVVVRLLLLEKIAAERRSDAQRPEVRPRDAVSADYFGLRVADRWRPAADGSPPLD